MKLFLALVLVIFVALVNGFPLKESKSSVKAEKSSFVHPVEDAEDNAADDSDLVPAQQFFGGFGGFDGFGGGFDGFGGGGFGEFGGFERGFSEFEAGFGGFEGGFGGFGGDYGGFY